jgi:2-haloacid dehalogenase
MMVAAHSSDLAHAAKLGLKTAHVARPNEHGPGKGEAAPKVPVDISAQSLDELAAKLGA